MNPEPGDLDRLLKEAANHTMTPEEKRAQAISFATGQCMLSNPDSTEEDEWQLRLWAAKWYDVTERLKQHGVTSDPNHVRHLMRTGLELDDA